MPPNNAVSGRALAVALLLLAVAATAASQPGATDLDDLRQQCIAAAHRLQQQDATVFALEHQIDLLGHDAAGRQRGLDESRTQQADLLGTLERIGRNSPQQPAFAFADPLDRLRSGMLVAAVAPALRAEARALGAETERIAALHRQIAARQRDLAGAQDAREKERQQLAPLVAARLESARKLLPEDPGAEARIQRLGREAGDLGDLIKRAEAAIERRDKDIQARARGAVKAEATKPTAEAADPTRPQLLHAFDPPQSAMLLPVSGTISRRFGAGEAGQGSAGLTLTALPAGEVVAPSDGRVVYAGPFRTYGLVLIIGHGGLYHSVLAGLGRIDVRLDQWLLAGEPVGAMPDAPAPDPSAAPGSVGVTSSVLYYELRHEGRPVDPQPWLAAHEDGYSREVPGRPETQTGDQRVRE